MRFYFACFVSTRLFTFPPLDFEDFDLGIADASPAPAAVDVAPAAAAAVVPVPVLEGAISRLPFSRRSNSSSRCFFSVSMLDGSCGEHTKCKPTSEICDSMQASTMQERSNRCTCWSSIAP